MPRSSRLPIVVYTPESKLKHPGRLIRDMWRDLLASRELAWRLMIRDISAQYRQSFLGIFWAFVPPLIMAVGFTYASNAQIINIGQTDLPYPAYVMLSTVLWQTFVEALNGPIQAVNMAKPMLAKINFPREALILGKVGEVFFNFGIKLILVAILFILFRMPMTAAVILAPVALIHLVLLGTAIGLFLSPLGVLYQDVSRGLVVAMGVWFFLTPVVYPVPTEGSLSWLVRFNPVTPLLVTARELATTGVVTNPIGFWLASGLALIGLCAAWIVYRLTMPIIIERMSA
ncbi:ABC transporter permease [Oscillatoria sp. CS-180]|uniref:ABC transporter permease n=1 Tax=Oscillatoria sp. CS-180 TaxID=3021720 RepID=UPI00232C9D97|nr:ABC transporter permease [Oscillatoria sp. CS-180]MDB9525400.1 ABC transporter permease [Oscillatoria sp. CS-180]